MLAQCYYITLHYKTIYSGQSKNCKVHYIQKYCINNVTVKETG